MESYQFYTNPGKSNPPPNSETQKLQLRNSETPTQKLRKSEFLSFRGRISEFPRQSFRVGQFRAVLALAQKVQNTTFTVVGRILGVFVPDFLGQNRATQKLAPQKLRNTNSEIGFPSFRVGLSEFRVRLSEFPKLRGFRAVRVRVDSNTLGPLKKCL